MEINAQTSHTVGHAYYVDQNWPLSEVQITFEEVDRLFGSCFEC